MGEKNKKKIRVKVVRVKIVKMNLKLFFNFLIDKNGNVFNRLKTLDMR